ncbi:MAG: hypothetical protein QOD74_2778, partial [Variibacter sp.]|nr:hypothetical protein [Variibacter sp.]
MATCMSRVAYRPASGMSRDFSRMSVSLRVVSFVGRFVLTGVAGISVTLPATAASVQTLETYIDDLKRPAEFDIRDVKATFAFVFNSLPERVNVYPT